MSASARSIAELVARDSYGRLVAILATHLHDVSLAEDALADAFVSALCDWPKTGVPANPVGWLVVAAQRKLVDGARRAHVRDKTREAVEAQLLGLSAREVHAIPDERLRMSSCAHTRRLSRRYEHR